MTKRLKPITLFSLKSSLGRNRVTGLCWFFILYNLKDPSDEIFHLCKYAYFLLVVVFGCKNQCSELHGKTHLRNDSMSQVGQLHTHSLISVFVLSACLQKLHSTVHLRLVLFLNKFQLGFLRKEERLLSPHM